MMLSDRDSFREIGSRVTEYGHEEGREPVSYDGVITGRAEVFGRPVFIFSQDFTVRGGSIGNAHGRKIARVIRLALEAGCPVIGIYDSAGARIDEGVKALAGCGEMMYWNSLASGKIPQFSVIAGPCAGAAAYSPALTDMIFSVEHIGNMFITGPDVIKNVTGVQCDAGELGGALVHSSVSGVSQFCFSNEKDCYRTLRRVISYLPTPGEKTEAGGFFPSGGAESVIPEQINEPYDVRGVIDEVCDSGSFIECSRLFAKSMVTGLAKLCGLTVGIVASQPCEKSGAIDCDSSDKASRFVNFCDCYGIPILTFVDTPGYLPGVEQEHDGIIRHGAKLIWAYSRAVTPKITVILRKAYGGAYIAMGSRHVGADLVYALPGAQIAVMGAQGAVSVLYRKKLRAITDEQERAALSEKLTDEYSEKFANPRAAAQEGYVDEIIDEKDIRERVWGDLKLLCAKSTAAGGSGHGNMPV